jgi:Cu-Zn family superoxide dismutase
VNTPLFWSAFHLRRRKSKSSCPNMKITSAPFGIFALSAFFFLGVPAGLAAPVTAAIAVILPTTGNATAGIVTFTATDGGVKVIADVTGLLPGKHGFHIHEFGDISDAAKAMSTGGHYDPDGSHHHALVEAGQADATPHHAGDMGNLTADSTGKAHLEVVLKGVSLTGPVNPLVGRAVIIHANADDGAQPVGNAGGRVGQGVIGIAQAK